MNFELFVYEKLRAKNLPLNVVISDSYFPFITGSDLLKIVEAAYDKGREDGSEATLHDRRR